MFECEEAPWRSNENTGGYTKIPSTVNQRSATTLRSCILPYDHDIARLIVWGTVALAKRGDAAPEEELFTSGHGKAFALIPTPRSHIPLRWAHYDSKAIPDDMANVPCYDLDAHKLLTMLNAIMATEYPLNRTLGLRACLEHFLGTLRDFGQVYDRMRRRWPTNFTTLLTLMEEQHRKDEKMRRDAVYSNWRFERHIQDSCVPPSAISTLTHITPASSTLTVSGFHLIPRPVSSAQSATRSTGTSGRCRKARQHGYPEGLLATSPSTASSSLRSSTLGRQCGTTCAGVT